MNNNYKFRIGQPVACIVLGKVICVGTISAIREDKKTKPYVITPYTGSNSRYASDESLKAI